MNPHNRQKKILVADDKEETCLYLKRHLERKDYSVVSVTDGAQAKKFIEKENFDFFLLDCSMPELSGFELIQIARSRNPGAKIILISGFPSVNNDIVRKFGGDLFIHKPIQLKEIDSILKSAEEAGSQ